MTTHAELCLRAERWIRARRYPIVLRDVRSSAISEQPDAIGFRISNDTLLVECKASRADFQRDRKKAHRRPTRGMGYWRWYMAPRGLLGAADLPEGWGLVEVAGAKTSIVVKATPFYEREEIEEKRLLVTALDRATRGWGRRMFGERAPAAADGDPSPAATAVLRKARKELAELRAEHRQWARDRQAVAALPPAPADARFLVELDEGRPYAERLTRKIAAADPQRAAIAAAAELRVRCDAVATVTELETRAVSRWTVCYTEQRYVRPA